MQRARSTELRVGAFVVASLAILTLITFSLGEQRNLFGARRSFFTRFHDVEGLRAGSPVRIGGVNVGAVDEVRFLDDGRVRVDFTVDEEAGRLVRQGSECRLANKGMLGDKLIEVTVGSGEPLPDGAEVPASESAALGTYLRKAGEVLEATKATAQHLEAATEPYADPAFARDVRRIAANLAAITDAMRSEDGAVHMLLTDARFADSLRVSAERLARLTGELAAAAADLRAITREVRQGDGSAHQFVYGQEGTRLLTSLADASGELSAMLAAIRSGDGTAHQLLYGDGGEELLANLTQASADLRAVTADLRAGRGTLGALLQDPSVYEDVKRLVGDLRRNEILRALVRYAIAHDERQAPVRAAPREEAP